MAEYTNEEIAAVVGIDPVTLAALVVAGSNLFDFLFGGNHAGSCGAFRDQYFDVKNTLTPSLDEAARLWSRAGITHDPLPTSIMADIGPLLGQAINLADSQFDDYKGRNLLGQTMFASRLHLLLFSRWISSTLFGTAQWSQMQVDVAQEWTRFLDQQRISMNQRLTTVEQSIGQIPSLTQRIQTLEKDSQIVYDWLYGISFSELPAIRSRLTSLEQNLFGIINPKVQNLEAAVGQLIGQQIPEIEALLQQMRTDIFFLKTPLPVQETLVQHGNRLAQLEKQKVQTVLPALQGLQDITVELATDLDVNVHPTLAIHNQQMVNIFTDLDVVVRKTVYPLHEQVPSWPRRVQPEEPTDLDGFFFRLPVEAIPVRDFVVQSA